MDKEKISERIILTLIEKGHQAFLAGGCVRDRLRNVEPKDFDITTSATPEEIQKIFKKTIPVGVQFGVILVIEEGHAFEVATFRKEGGYQDGRRPDEVEYSTVEEDAKRRDFTVNGLYYDIVSKKVLDFVGGQADLKLKIIRTIGDPQTRFLEDHLRMLRAVRFSVQLGFELEPSIKEVITKNAALISKVSWERIRDELSKLLTSSSPADGIRLLDEVSLLEKILPEVITLKGVEQPMEYHPEGDVYIHTLMLLEGLKNAPIELAMGCLLHDIAKPATFVRAPDRIRFHGHDVLGAKMAKEICKRLTFSNEQTEIICSLVKEHLRFKDAFQMRESTLRRFLSLDHFDLHLELHRLDCLASHKDLRAYEFCKEKWAYYKSLPPPPQRLVGGEDLMALGFKPGPQFKKILHEVEDAILEGQIHTKEEAISYVKKNFKV